MSVYDEIDNEQKAMKQADKDADQENTPPSTYGDLKDGENALRVLPLSPATLRYCREKGLKTSPFRHWYKHLYEIEVERGKTAWVAYACPHLTDSLGKGCEDCDEARELKASEYKRDRDRGYKLGAKHRVSFVAVDRDDPRVPKVYEISAPSGQRRKGNTVWEKIMANLKMTKISVDVYNPRAGNDLIITKEGKGLDTVYTVVADPTKTPLHKDESIGERWILQASNLYKTIRPPTMAEIEAIRRGEDPRKKEDRDEEPRRGGNDRGRSSGGRTAQAAVEQDEEDEWG